VSVDIDTQRSRLLDERSGESKIVPLSLWITISIPALKSAAIRQGRMGEAGVTSLN
jgi:hypothetical protein